MIHETLTLGASVDKLSSEHSLDGDEIFDSLLVPVRVSEDNLGKGRTSARVMNNVLHNTLNVAKQWKERDSKYVRFSAFMSPVPSHGVIEKDVLTPASQHNRGF